MGDNADMTTRRWRRTTRTAAASAVLATGVLVLPGLVQAQESAPEAAPVRNGQAKAIAIIGKIAPGVGQLELAITTGTAVTQVTNALAQATSQAADLGLIGSSLTAEGCDGGDATITADQLPQPTFVDNREGDTSARRSEAGQEGSPLNGGDMQVFAEQAVPEARAVTTFLGLDAAPGLTLGGGRAESITRVLPDEGREAIAIVENRIDIGGVVQLSGLRWTASHRTGLEPAAEATFELGRAAIGGVPLPIEDLGAAQDAINTALAPLGVTIQLPRVERFVEPADLVRVTPLRIEIRDSPAGKTVLGPVLDATREQRVQLFDDLTAAYCDAAAALLVADIATSVAAGTGFLTIDLGGAEAGSGDLELGNPFGEIPPPNDGGLLAPVVDALPSIPGVAIPPASPGGIVAPPVGQGPAVPVVDRGPIEELCESLHPNGSPGCSEGAAATVGVIGLLATAAVAAADVIRQRRRIEETS